MSHEASFGNCREQQFGGDQLVLLERQSWIAVKVKQEDRPNSPQKRLRPNPAVREALQNSGVFEARSASAKPRAAPQSPRAPPPPWRVKKEVHMTLHSVLPVNVERDFRLLTIDTACETSVTGLSCLYLREGGF